ncbi:MAG: hypothetical protein NZ893_02490, partial [Candidatus Aenigmarchaeota archaeon]|nr:hypothetical protein [Candidatus Aenigmarchaeota archaeon]
NEIILTHIGFGNTPKEIIINIFNNRTENLENPSIYVNGSLFSETNMLVPPKGSVNYFLILEPGVHEIEVRYRNVSSPKITIASNIILTPPDQQNQKQTSIHWISIAVLSFIVLLLVYFLIIKKPKLI